MRCAIISMYAGTAAALCMREILARSLIGLRGPRLTPAERRALRDSPPRGVILFARNIETPKQLRRLLTEARDRAGRDLWAAIDEEGGPVSRLPWPPFSGRAAAAEFGRMHARSAEKAVATVYEQNLACGEALRELGFTHNCAPVLDLFHAGAHAVIGKRAFGSDVERVTALGSACMRGLHAAGIEAVGKHFPGHGRTTADSHVSVPVVPERVETLMAEAEPFRRLIREGLRHIMTAHVVYSRADARVATLSPFWIGEVLRRRFRFRGTVWSDDLCMRGVGDHVCLAGERALRAGCDVLLVCDPDSVARMYRELTGPGSHG